jgi:hypothetical protein
MKNEPVAWMSADGKFNKKETWLFPIPLYTHPVNPKYDPETGEPLIDGYPLFSGLPHPVKELDEQFKKGFEAGKEEGWKAHKFHHPVKELTDEDRSMLIRTLKWAEDLLREAGHDEAVNDVQDCLMILRKAQEK